jgi:putative SOS response-associated peptidase YedK
MHWGLIPSRAKAPSIGSRMINVRSESVHEKPAFRQAIRYRRCIIPANGFFEWRQEGKLKHLYQPYPADLMEMYPVSPLVNSPRNDSPDLIKPLN